MKYIVSNFKMAMNLAAVTKWLEEFNKAYCECESDQLEVIIAPSNLYIAGFLGVKSAKLALQDVSDYEQGAHTGSVGAFQAKDYVKYCIVGHSETKDTPEKVISKRDVCLKNGITPIVCFIHVADAKNYYTPGVLLLWEDPENISKDGVFNPKDPALIEQEIRDIKATLPAEAKVLYGGSVNSQNAQAIAAIANLDGCVVGSASLDPLGFIDIIRAYEIYES